MEPSKFTMLGEGCAMGTYLLFIRLDRPLRICFGRFRGGRPVEAPAGEYVYVGSALGRNRSATALAGRLLRHASRTGRRSAHRLRPEMLRLFRAAGLIEGRVRKAPEKHLRWHIDYLLDRPEAELFHVVAIQSPQRLEEPLSELLNRHPATEALAPRLGAQDAKSGAHLLRLLDTGSVMAAAVELAGNSLEG
ncbi:GIY-YIG nuclease family protein [Chlorobium sp. N1]|uniref:GIY-YIG nuclease family protein n=1 Tax=Chlorobium sp. N1 TaxID=2491138 RepID=UPI00103EF2FB|nr:GIY-YIG nuclease family protein [Chlorobium sp. N1]TCD47995.1 GIY-YIG nuclease family protein [Chlorobium sp. N1]